MFSLLSTNTPRVELVNGVRPMAAWTNSEVCQESNLHDPIFKYATRVGCYDDFPGHHAAMFKMLANSMLAVPDEFLVASIQSREQPRTRSKSSIVGIPGFTEDVRDTNLLRFYNTLSGDTPTGVTVIGNNGIGIVGGTDRSHDYADVAQERFELLAETQDKRKTIIVARSMGTVITNQLLMQNRAEGKPVDIASVVYAAPAIVENVLGTRIKAFANFVPQMLRSAAQEAVQHKRPPTLHEAADFARRGHQAIEERKALIHQLKELVQGIPIDELDEVIAHNRLDVVLPLRDSLGQLAMWGRMQEKHPDNLRVHIVPGGHDILFHTKMLSNLVSSALAA